MKKITAIVLLACMLFALTACGETAAPAEPAPAAEAPAAEAPAAEEPAAEEPAAPAAATYFLGLGVEVSTDSSADGNAQVDATAAAVVLDENGAIVSCRIDVAQNKMDITAGTADTEATFLTKVEKGPDYNMATYSEATYEWFEQAASFEQYVVGKTAAEVEGIELRTRDDSEPHPGYVVAADEALFATCSIQITDFIAAVVKACNDAQGMSFEAADAFALGLAINSVSDESTDAGDEDGVVKMYSEFGAAVVGADGTVLAALNDAIQPQISYDKDGVITGTKFGGTKRELGDNYNMVTYGAAIAEWFEQSAAFSQYCVGKTAAEIEGLETTVNEEGHQVSVDETLFAQCTMSIGGMMAVIAKAANNAK